MLRHFGLTSSKIKSGLNLNWQYRQRRWLGSTAPHQHGWPSTISAPIQSYVSTTHDPFVNLSIENYLLQHSPPESAVLFLYRNRPCVVFGRNQNPWLELNLRECLRLQAKGELDIVRRRSGGGTVFHDLGNVNWTVISPPKGFTRDKHAEMVVRALRSDGCRVERARVNERHDIVLDQGTERKSGVDPEDMHLTPWTSPHGLTSLKCSGSAYKLTRNRALHHGTCLLDSKSLGKIGTLLRSPAREYISAKGVESVRSPVGNTGVQLEIFVREVQEAFSRLYTGSTKSYHPIEISEEVLQEPKIRSELEEMRTKEWTYGQTPQFRFSTRRQDPGAHTRTHKPASIREPAILLDLEIRHGQITDVQQRNSFSAEAAQLSGLLRESLYGLHGWATIIAARTLQLKPEYENELTAFLEQSLPIVNVNLSFQS